MVDVAQLVEPRIVIPAVAGSSPVVHPTYRVQRHASADVIPVEPIEHALQCIEMQVVTFLAVDL